MKMHMGHRGANQPVKDLETGKVEITSQNHNFAVDPESLPEVRLLFCNRPLTLSPLKKCTRCIVPSSLLAISSPVPFH